MPVSPDIYAGKDPAYYGTPRLDFVQLAPVGPHRVLEIGCGTGATLRALKAQGKAAEIVGVDLIAPPELPPESSPDLSLESPAASAAPSCAQSPPGPARFFAGDIEHLDLPYPPGYFDVVIAGEVLEHLIDPWAVTRRLSALLKPGGTFLVSVPNIRHYAALWQIAWRGSFPQRDRGPFDRTHLRFFCKRDLRHLLGQAGLEVELMLGARPAWACYLHRATFGLFEEFLAWQYVVVARKLG